MANRNLNQLQGLAASLLLLCGTTGAPLASAQTAAAQKQTPPRSRNSLPQRRHRHRPRHGRASPEQACPMSPSPSTPSRLTCARRCTTTLVRSRISQSLRALHADQRAAAVFQQYAAAGSVLRDGKIYLSLSDAITLALENNYDIAIAAHQSRYRRHRHPARQGRRQPARRLRRPRQQAPIGGTTSTITGGGGPGGTSIASGGAAPAPPASSQHQRRRPFPENLDPALDRHTEDQDDRPQQRPASSVSGGALTNTDTSTTSATSRVSRTGTLLAYVSTTRGTTTNNHFELLQPAAAIQLHAPPSPSICCRASAPASTAASSCRPRTTAASPTPPSASSSSTPSTRSRTSTGAWSAPMKTSRPRSARSPSPPSSPPTTASSSRSAPSLHSTWSTPTPPSPTDKQALISLADQP